MALWPQRAPAQQVEYPLSGTLQSPIASLNRDRLISSSTYGSALLRDLAERQSALVEENERLGQELEREELALTETRKTMEPAEFAPLAEAFDDKANRIRAQQEGKAVELAKALETMRFSFFREVEPVIVQVMQERGISILLNEQAVMLSVGGADITVPVLERLDQLHANGELGKVE